MNDTSPLLKHRFSSSLMRREVRFLVILCFLPVLSFFSPRALGVVPGLLGVIFFVLWRVKGGVWSKIPPGLIYIAAGLSGLAAVSSLWAFEDADALERAGKMTLVLWPCVLLVAVLNDISSGRALFTRWFPLSVILSGLLCLLDLYGEGIIYAHLHDKHWIGDKFNLSLLNRQINAFCLLCIPAFYLLWKGRQSKKYAGILFGMLLLVLLAILYITHSQSSQVMLILALIFACVFPVARGWAWKGSLAFTVAMICAAPWIAQGLYNGLAEGMSEAGQWVRDSYAADRTEIWDMVARKALESPIYGFGIEATRAIESFDTAKLYTPHDHVLHPHNATLQLWIEFGAIGAVLMSIICYYVFKSMERVKNLSDRRFVIALFAGVFFMMNTTYGVWQSWWLGLILTLTGIAVYICKMDEQGQGGESAD